MDISLFELFCLNLPGLQLNPLIPALIPDFLKVINCHSYFWLVNHPTVFVYHHDVVQSLLSYEICEELYGGSIDFPTIDQHRKSEAHLVDHEQKHSSSHECKVLVTERGALL